MIIMVDWQNATNKGETMNSNKYTIKPLQWESYVLREISAKTIFGTYYIEKLINGRCFWSWHNDASKTCLSFEDGKKQVWNHWVKKMEMALDEAE